MGGRQSKMWIRGSGGARRREQHAGHQFRQKPEDLAVGSLEHPEAMFSDPEDPLSWEEKFGNFNLAKFGEGERTRPLLEFDQ